MRALRLFGAGDIRLVEIPEPKITEEEILLKTDAAAVCGTDIRMWKNGHKGVDAEHPLTLGHEFSGTIVETGTKVPFYKKGMKVAMQPNIGCGICEKTCTAGAVKVVDSCAVIEDAICLSCGMCAVKCPRHAIYDLRGIYTAKE